jgi:hypothetical protein
MLDADADGPFPSAICVYYWITRYYCASPTPLSVRCAHADRATHAAGAIIFTIIALVSVLAYFGYRLRIPFASLLLQVVMDVSKHHMSVFLVAFLAAIVQAALSV